MLSSSLDNGSKLQGSLPIALIMPYSQWSGREKQKEKWDDKKRVENREGSLGYPGFVTPVSTKESKPLGKRKRSLGHLGIVTPVLT
ncbi:hypothetical protein TNCV_2394291 [Trichonephila clavipes]|nr:hypothetical protein TNCV_2394291 [Trichonephila clavipes]